MPSTDYSNPDDDSKRKTYQRGKPIKDGQSFDRIRERNIDNLEKEYNYVYPRCLDLYKKWKYALLNKNSEASNLETQYNLCSYKLDELKNKLDEANKITSEEIEIIKSRTNKQDENIFRNQKEIDNSTNVLKEKQRIVNTDTNKVEDYNQLNNSMSNSNIIWIILLIIFIGGTVALAYFYFFSEGVQGGQVGSIES